MPANASSSQSRIDKFWNRYIYPVKNQGVISPFDRWYVIRAEQYLKFSEKKLRDHTLTELELFLEDI